MPEQRLPATLGWVRSKATTPIPAGWVPGAADHEREALGSLASVVAHALGTDPPANWPTPLRDWLAAPADLPEEVAEEVEKALAVSPDAALASVYAQLVAGERRRVLGTFFTPEAEVEPMLEMWDSIEQPPTEVVDVGAGVGVFTAAAAQRWRDARVAAVDVNPVTLGLLGARMAQVDVADCHDRVDLVLDDFTTWLPANAAAAGARRLILGNPPYTRSQLIDPALRSRLAEETADLCGRRASLSAYITALTLQHLEDHDGLCLLLPAQWLESDYACGLRRHLLNLRDRQVQLRLVNSSLFDDAMVDAVVLLVGTRQAQPQAFTVATWGDDEARAIDRSTASVQGWRAWFTPEQSTTDHSDARSLRDIARVRRGTATGANEFFLLSDDLVAAHKLPAAALKPAVRRLRDYGNSVTQATFDRQAAAERRWMLVANPKTAKLSRVGDYIRFGEEAGFDERHLCAVRAGDWYDLAHDLFVPDVIITAMTRGRVHIVENTIDAAITNNLYGWVWNDGTTKRVRKKILEWLRSEAGQASLLAKCRSQANGLAKVEPKALASLKLPPELFD